jgi:hypothetical protein
MTETIIMSFFRENIVWILYYCFVSTTVIITMLFTGIQRKRKYLVWKKDTLNLYVFKREWELNSDQLLEELFSENDRLNKENKLLKEKVTELSIVSLLMLLITALTAKIGSHSNTRKRRPGFNR